MAKNPNPSLLDAGQIIKRAFDDTEDRLRVDAEVTANISGAQEVIIDAVDDSIRIEDGAGNALAIEADGSINANVTITGVATETTLSAINTKVSTAAKQDTGNTSLSSIDTKLSSQATATKQDTGNTSLSSIDGKLPSNLTVTSTRLLVDGSGVTQPISDAGGSLTVDGTVAATQSGTWNINNVSGAISLPTGAATSALQGALKTTSITGTPQNLVNEVLWSIDTSGYNMAYITAYATGTVLGYGRIKLEVSPNNVNWSPYEFQEGQYVNTLLFCYFDGLTQDPLSQPVIIRGRYLRAIVYDLSEPIPSGLMNSDVFLTSSVSPPDLYRTSTYLVQPNGNELVGQMTMEASVPVVIASDQNPITIKADFSTQQDTFTGTTSGTTIDRTTSPLRTFSIQVKATGAVTSWDVRLEGSLDGINFTQILQHTNATPGDGLIVFSGSLSAPCLYFRSRVNALILGGGTNIVATILGMI